MSGIAEEARPVNDDPFSSEAPLITIGISCFNAIDTLERTINSALHQDWPNKEILIVDDASTDGCQARARGMATQHPALRLISHPNNKGYAAALNTIITASTGDFIAIFDDDDESRHDRLTKQWKRVTEYERVHGDDLILCYANRAVVRARCTKADHFALAIGREAPEPKGPIVAGYLFGYLADTHHVWGMLGSCTLLARRRTFLAVGNFDEKFRRCAELDFAVRAAIQGAHFIAVNEPLVVQHKTPSADKSGRIPIKYALELRRKHKEYLTHERVYLASLIMAHAWFHGNAGRFWRHRFFLALAYCLLPPSVLAAKIRSRLMRQNSVAVLSTG